MEWGFIVAGISLPMKGLTDESHRHFITVLTFCSFVEDTEEENGSGNCLFQVYPENGC